MTESWGYRTFKTYRLRRVDLEGFLKAKFGNYNFYITVCTLRAHEAYPTDSAQVEAGGVYRFWIPRALTEVCDIFVFSEVTFIAELT
jgi:hypothetical protein